MTTRKNKEFVLVTTVSLAKTGTNSLRATIPEGIVAFLQLQDGDKISWTMQNVGKYTWSTVRRVNKRRQR